MKVLDRMSPLDSIRCIVFDFAGTLCSESYFKPLGEAWLGKVEELVFKDSSSRWADPWMSGELSAQDICDYLSHHLPFSAQQIQERLHQGCAELTFNAGVWKLAEGQRQKGRKTALVTGNMDVFTEIVVPRFGLNGLFDVIINSSDYRERRKEVLWRYAFGNLGERCDFACSVLIEDSLANVLKFGELGGIGYHYTGDGGLRQWIEEVGL